MKKEHSHKDNLKVVYEDNHLIVVNKRAGDIVQGDKTGDKPLSDVVKAYLKEKYNKPTILISLNKKICMKMLWHFRKVCKSCLLSVVSQALHTHQQRTTSFPTTIHCFLKFPCKRKLHEQVLKIEISNVFENIENWVLSRSEQSLFQSKKLCHDDWIQSWNYVFQNYVFRSQEWLVSFHDNNTRKF